MANPIGAIAAVKTARITGTALQIPQAASPHLFPSALIFCPYPPTTTMELPSTDTPAIDAELIRLNLGALGEDAAECLTFLTQTFTEDTPGILAQMRQGAEQRDAATLRINAHTLKSSSATLGAASLSELCRILEAKARAEDLSQTVELVDQVEAAYAAAKVALETFQW